VFVPIRVAIYVLFCFSTPLHSIVTFPWVRTCRRPQPSMINELQASVIRVRPTLATADITPQTNVLVLCPTPSRSASRSLGSSPAGSARSCSGGQSTSRMPQSSSPTSSFKTIRPAHARRRARPEGMAERPPDRERLPRSGPDPAHTGCDRRGSRCDLRGVLRAGRRVLRGGRSRSRRRRLDAHCGEVEQRSEGLPLSRRRGADARGAPRRPEREARCR
jgi:hypothetical protein